MRFLKTFEDFHPGLSDYSNDMLQDRGDSLTPQELQFSNELEELTHFTVGDINKSDGVIKYTLEDDDYDPIIINDEGGEYSFDVPDSDLYKGLFPDKAELFDELIDYLTVE